MANLEENVIKALKELALDYIDEVDWREGVNCQSIAKECFISDDEERMDAYDFIDYWFHLHDVGVNSFAWCLSTHLDLYSNDYNRFDEFWESDFFSKGWLNDFGCKNGLETADEMDDDEFVRLKLKFG